MKESEKLEEYALSIGFKYGWTDPDCISYYTLGYVQMCFTGYQHIGCQMSRYDSQGERIRCYTTEDIDNALVKLNIDLKREIEIVIPEDNSIEWCVKNFLKSLDVNYKKHYASGLNRITIVYHEKLK